MLPTLVLHLPSPTEGQTPSTLLSESGNQEAGRVYKGHGEAVISTSLDPEVLPSRAFTSAVKAGETSLVAALTPYSVIISTYLDLCVDVR